MKEQYIQAKISKWLKSQGYYYVVIIQARPGVPDILACVNGTFVGIEVKLPKTKHNTENAQGSLEQLPKSNKR